MELDEKKCRIKEVEALQAMGTMITKEADSMSAMRFRRMKAPVAFGMDIKFLTKTRKFLKGGITKPTEKVQPRILHSCEGWGWNKEMVDAPHEWESRKFDLMSSRKWIKRGLRLDWFRVNQIRMARKRFAEGGGESMECLMLQRS